MSSRGNSAERDTRFSGYGDRVGSGVELAPTKWKGGEVFDRLDFNRKTNFSLLPIRLLLQNL